MNRLFEIIYLLLERKQMTAGELAEHFEVSQRTIYRDIDKLSLAGVPVYMTKGKNGGISLMQDFVLNKALLNESERNDIIASLQAMNSVQMTEVQAIDKLKGLFGKTELDWIEIEFSNWGKEDLLNHYFDSIKQAILSNQMISFLYISVKGERMKREVKPARLCFRGQAWYLYGYCMERKDYRFFKLLRMEELQLLEKKFVPEYIGKVLQPHKNTQAIKKEEQGGDNQEERKSAKKEAQHETVRIRIKAAMAYRAYDELRDIKPQENGDVICQIEVPDWNWFYHYVLSFGEDCLVLEPQNVRDTIQQMLRNTINQYK